MQSRILLKSKVVSTFPLIYIASNHKQTYTVSHDSSFNSTQCLIIITACLRYQSKCISARFVYSFACKPSSSVSTVKLPDKAAFLLAETA